MMDIAGKKVELIQWLARLQDEKIILRLETLRKVTIGGVFKQRTPNTLDELQTKIDRSEKDFIDGKIHSQEEVESYFKARFQQ